jgi:2-methylisocitrate lyase-like PEP mutase family enzyme
MSTSVVSTDTTSSQRRDRFRALHSRGLFLLPNAWDLGSARLLEWLGMPAIATTSSGHAASLGRMDYHVNRDEMVSHVRAIVDAVTIPVHVDAARGYPEARGGVRRTIELLIEAGAAGASIEDYDPAGRRIEPLRVAAERVAMAATAASKAGVLITARAENYLYGIDDLSDTIERLIAYRDAGAAVVYAPGMAEPESIKRVVEDVGRPVNVLLRRTTPNLSALAAIGVRRVSTGGGLAFAAYGVLAESVKELMASGTPSYLDQTLAPHALAGAFGTASPKPAE